MEALVILAVFFFLFSIVRKAGKMTQGTAGPAQSQPHAQAQEPLKDRVDQLMEYRLERWTPQLQKFYPQPSISEGGSLMAGGMSLEGESQEGTSSDEGRFASGSLEGTDTCDTVLQHGRTISFTELEIAQQEEQPGLSLSFEPNSILQGIVMSEIIMRPAQRKWGKRYK